MRTKSTEKWRASMIAKYGSIEAWKDHQRIIARQGRANHTTKTGFGIMSADRLREVASKGGKAPRKKLK